MNFNIHIHIAITRGGGGHRWWIENAREQGAAENTRTAEVVIGAEDGRILRSPRSVFVSECYCGTVAYRFCSWETRKRVSTW